MGGGGEKEKGFPSYLTSLLSLRRRGKELKKKGEFFIIAHSSSIHYGAGRGEEKRRKKKGGRILSYDALNIHPTEKGRKGEKKGGMIS